MQEEVTPKAVKFVDAGWEIGDGPEALEAWLDADPTGVRRAIADICNAIADKDDEKPRDSKEEAPQ